MILDGTSASTRLHPPGIAGFDPRGTEIGGTSRFSRPPISAHRHRAHAGRPGRECAAPPCRATPALSRHRGGYPERRNGWHPDPRMGACRDDRARAGRDAHRIMSERLHEPTRSADVAGDQRSSGDPSAAPLRRCGSTVTRRAAATRRRRPAVPRPSARPATKAFLAPRHGGRDGGSPVPNAQTAVELERIRIQQERIASWRSGALRVIELPRHWTENGWSYDRAA